MEKRGRDEFDTIITLTCYGVMGMFQLPVPSRGVGSQILPIPKICGMPQPVFAS